MSINKKVSIIIPVYNAQGILDRCITSVLAQSLTDFELILVNDGSKDTSGSICDNYAATDERITVFHKVNGGVSSARNFGLSHANGEFITFIDADDYVGADYLRTFFALESSPKQTLVQQGYLNEFRRDKIREVKFENHIYGQMEFENLFTTVDLTRSMPHPFPKLYDAAIIKDHDIRYDENFHNGEDIMFLLTYIYYINRCILVNSREYHYSYSLGSLSYWYGSFEVESQLFLKIKQKLDLIIEKFNLSQNFYYYYAPSFLFRAISSLYLYPNRKPRPFRIRSLKELAASKNSDLILNNECRSLVEKAFKYFFVRDRFYLCDAVLFTFASLRVFYYHYRRIAE